MQIEKIKTLGALKAAGYQSKSIKTELRDNLIEKLKNGEPTFDGIYGYEDSVIPELERAILSKHNINLLGLRGQAKTRLARLMLNLLDEYIPVVEGSEINDDPLNPLSRVAKEIIEKQGDDTAITWLHRSERFYEKLATPDVTISDLIGDIDPIKAANLKLSYSDERVIHFGMIPRANRCIFVINELPDLQARIQVALFNILEEGDIQIRGFKLRMPLDLQFVFTANPEDYTNRGSIVTPLKDRIGSQILTHYPQELTVAKSITQQETSIGQKRGVEIEVPELAKDMIELIGFEARKSDYIDAKSGVSARMSITAYDNMLSTAERRSILSQQDKTTVRLSDIIGVIPSITGKVELVYEGEQEGASFVANELILLAAKDLFHQYFPKIEKLSKSSEQGPYDALLEWFIEQGSFELLDDISEKAYQQKLNAITPLQDLVNQYAPKVNMKEALFLKEVVLWALVAYEKLSRKRFTRGYQIQDPHDQFISDLSNNLN